MDETQETNQQSDGEQRTDSSHPVTRRQVIGALAGAGVFGSVASGASQNEGDGITEIGGGSMASEIGDLRIKQFQGTFDERPSAGVANRVYVVNDPGHAEHGAVYYDDGSSWTLQDRKVGKLSAEDVSGTRYVREYDGDDLPSKIRAAIDDLPNGHGEVIVSPKEDGSPWEWPTNLTINPLNYNSFVVNIQKGTDINVTASGYAITIDGSNDQETIEQSKGKRTAWIGGDWDGSNATDPDGWFRAIDAFRTIIDPDNVNNFTNSSNDSSWVRLENDTSFCEQNEILGKCNNVDIGIDMAPASVTGGSGAESFQDTLIDHVGIGSVQNIGIRFRGNPRYCQVNKPTIFAAGDGFTGMLFDGDMEGTTIISPKVEDSGALRADTTGIATGPNYVNTKAPVIIQGGFVKLDSITNRNASNHHIPRLRYNRDGPEMENLGTGVSYALDMDLSQFILNSANLKSKKGDAGTNRVHWVAADSDGTLRFQVRIESNDSPVLWLPNGGEISTWDDQAGRMADIVGGQVIADETGHGIGVRNAEDLSSKTGNFGGEQRFNDGTTGQRGYYWWDESAAGGDDLWHLVGDYTTTL